MRDPVRYARCTAFAVLVAILVSGCNGGVTPPQATPDSVPPTGGALGSAGPSESASVGPDGLPPPTRPDCARGIGRFVVTPNGVGVLLLGQGDAGVVLAPQSRGGICQWLPYARNLARHYQIALFDWQGSPQQEPPAAVRVLRRSGASRIVLAGASMGGAYAMAEGHRIHPALAGIVSLSGELELRQIDARPGIAAWGGPLLVVGSAHDALFRADARTVQRLHHGPETVLVVPGQAHGVDLLDGPSSVQVQQAIQRFLRNTLD